MIALTRLDGEPFALNEDLIERIEPNADTTIFTVRGNVYAVTESSDDVIEAVREAKAAILRSISAPAPTPRPRLHAIVDGTAEEVDSAGSALGPPR